MNFIYQSFKVLHTKRPNFPHPPNYCEQLISGWNFFLLKPTALLFIYIPSYVKQTKNATHNINSKHALTHTNWARERDRAKMFCATCSSNIGQRIANEMFKMHEFRFCLHRGQSLLIAWIFVFNVMGKKISISSSSFNYLIKFVNANKVIWFLNKEDACLWCLLCAKSDRRSTARVALKYIIQLQSVRFFRSVFI